VVRDLPPIPDCTTFRQTRDGALVRKVWQLTVVFLVENWEGTLRTSTDETCDARFFSMDDLPADMRGYHRETIDDLLRFTSETIIK
jgi:hypothetical protein